MGVEWDLLRLRSIKCLDEIAELEPIMKLGGSQSIVGTWLQIFLVRNR